MSIDPTKLAAALMSAPGMGSMLPDQAQQAASQAYGSPQKTAAATTPMDSANHPLGPQFEEIMFNWAKGAINTGQAQRALKSLGFQADMRRAIGNEVDIFPLSGGFPVRTTF